MNTANVQLITGFFDRVRQGDVPGATSILASDIVWLESGLPPLGGTHHGREAVIRDVLIPFVSQFSNFSATPDRMLEAGDEVVVCGRYRGVLNSTGRPVEARFVNIFKVNNGTVTRVEQTADTAHFVAPATR